MEINPKDVVPRRQVDNPLNIEMLSKAWAEDETMMGDLWQCCYGIFARQLDWENFLEGKAMKKLKFTYIDDGRKKEGTDQRGNKGCVAKLATKVKQDILKQINRRAKNTHGKMILAGRDPEYTIVNGKEKKKKKNNSTEFSFDEENNNALAENMVCCHCLKYIIYYYCYMHSP
jgi:hypothetical protein